MRQLVFLGPGRAEWREAAEPAVDGALAAIVEPVAGAARPGEATSFGRSGGRAGDGRHLLSWRWPAVNTWNMISRSGSRF
jgi:hypothetical protein